MFLVLVACIGQCLTQSRCGLRSFKPGHVFESDPRWTQPIDAVDQVQERFGSRVIEISHVSTARKRLARRRRPPNVGVPIFEPLVVQRFHFANEHGMAAIRTQNGRSSLIDVDGRHDLADIRKLSRGRRSSNSTEQFKNSHHAIVVKRAQNNAAMVTAFHVLRKDCWRLRLSSFFPDFERHNDSRNQSH